LAERISPFAAGICQTKSNARNEKFYRSSVASTFSVKSTTSDSNRLHLAALFAPFASSGPITSVELKQRLSRQLRGIRELSERLLADFQTPEQWTFQAHPACNHALWFAGHMATSDNFFLSLVAPDRVQPLPAFQEKFGMGSQPTSDPAAYPAPESVVAAMRERRQSLLAVLDGMTEEDLAKKTPAGAPEFLPDVASVFELAVWHEGQHRGQLSVARRALGHKPLR
jgi:uncharacterized damage-inducible protein DinB